MVPREEGEQSGDEDTAPGRSEPDAQHTTKAEEQKHSASVAEKRRRDNSGTRHDAHEREPAEKRRRDEHSRRDDHRRDHRSSRYDREKDRDRERGSERERAHDREHGRHRESDKDRRDLRAATHRSDKGSERTRDASRPERPRQERSDSQSGAGRKEAGPSSRDKRNPKDADTEEAGQAPTTGHKNGHSPMNPAEDEAAQDKAAPKSLEEVLHRKQEAEQEAARPKFLSRKDREQAALERNKQRAEAVRRQAEAARAALQRPSSGSAAQQRDSTGQQERLTAKEMQEREKQRTIIRQQYLGQKQQKRRIAKASDKFRFNFDWDASEDTHEEKLHEGALLFGRGKLAGIDMKAQCEAAAQKEKLLLSDMRRARGDMTTEADRKADNARAARAAAIDEDPVLREKHWKEKKREQMSQRDWRIFREDHRISYRNAGKDAPMPYRNWEEMLLPQKLADAVRDLNYTQPSPIQMASAPFGFRQRDVIGLAETGSGKTAAFVLPMLKYIMEQPPMTDALAAEGPYALILAPTRELAQQIEEETIGLAKYTGFNTACIVGGASYEVQKGKLRKGAEIVVATPGRLLDCLQKRYAVLNQCAYIVLDEADRMIDLGFEPQVIEVLAAMPASNMKPLDAPEEDISDGPTDTMIQEGKLYRTTYMFSATMPIAVERIAKRYLRRPVTVVVGSAGRAVDSVTQRIEWIDRKQKPAALMRTLDTFQAELEHSSSDNEGFKIICFVNNRENSEDVYNQLAKTAKYNVALLHGGKSQEQREECIGGFREGDYDVMIATDVAGRGIDVRDVGLVINYDMPHTIENYTHRIGRTGRAGRKGTAVTFLTSGDEKTFFDLKNLLEECKAHVPQQLAQHDSAKFKPGQFDQSKKDTILYAS